MISDEGLLAVDIETLFVLDGAGDLVSSNEPTPKSRRAAPRAYVAWTSASHVVRFRHDVPQVTRRQILAWVDDVRPRDLDKRALDPGPGKVILGARHTGEGPTYRLVNVPKAPEDPDLLRIGREHAELLAHTYPETVEEIDTWTPFFAYVADGQAVSLALSSRRGSRACEAGVDTKEAYRRRGFGAAVTLAWAAAVAAEGREPIYSTSWENAASRRLAEKVGFRCFSACLSIA